MSASTAGACRAALRGARAGCCGQTHSRRCRRDRARALAAMGGEGDAAGPELSALRETFNTEMDPGQYVPLGRGVCFTMGKQSAKIEEQLVIEPIPACGLEAMSKGMATSYTHVYGSTLGEALAMDTSLLPAEFADAQFAQEFAFRCESAARTWDRPWPKEALMCVIASRRPRARHAIDRRRARLTRRALPDRLPRTPTTGTSFRPGRSATTSTT